MHASHNSLSRCDAATNDADINDVFGKRGSQGASTDHKAPSGAQSGGSEAKETGRATSARGTNGRHTCSSVAGEAWRGSVWHCLGLLPPQHARMNTPSCPSLFTFCPSCMLMANEPNTNLFKKLSRRFLHRARRRCVVQCRVLRALQPSMQPAQILCPVHAMMILHFSTQALQKQLMCL